MWKLGSLFDGLGGFPQAGLKFGVDPRWASEIEPFPISVTTARIPTMAHLGDVTKINGAEIEPVDIMTFGSPCTDLSIAGKRAGMAGARSGLFHEAVRIIREMRIETLGEYPRFAIWENVPGAFSSNGGLDFKTVIEELIETEVPMPRSGKWAPAGMVRGLGRSLAWRTLDAQYWGVPQRRKRIYLVCDFRGQRAGEIFSEPESLPGNSAPGEGAGQGIAGGAAVGVGGTEYLTGWDNQEKRVFTDRGIAPTLSGSDGGGGRTAAGYILPVAFAQNQRDEVRLMDKAGALAAEPGMTQQTYICSMGFCPEEGAKTHSIGYAEEQSPTLRANAPPAICYGPGGQQDIAHALRAEASKADKPTSTTYVCVTGDKTHCLKAEGFDGSEDGTGRGQPIVAQIAPTIPSRERGGGGLGTDFDCDGGLVSTGYRVRRLLPIECLRLMGLPDTWLDDIPGNSDTAKYKAIGNGLAQPCADFVAGRVVNALWEELME